MDFFPFNLVLAVAIASSTIFLGFLPTRQLKSAFFARESLKAGVAWIGVALTSSPAICHWHYLLAFLCWGAWWQMSRDRALNGKMWLSIASGLGISLGVIYILQTTPRGYPALLPSADQGLLLASIYLGGAVVGLAYVCSVLLRAVSHDVDPPYETIAHYAGLLKGLVLVRAGILLVELFLHDSRTGLWIFSWSNLLLLPITLLIILGFLGRREIHSSSRALPFFSLLGGLGFVTELLARWLVL